MIYFLSLSARQTCLMDVAQYLEKACCRGFKGPIPPPLSIRSSIM